MDVVERGRVIRMRMKVETFARLRRHRRKRKRASGEEGGGFERRETKDTEREGEGREKVAGFVLDKIEDLYGNKEALST